MSIDKEQRSSRPHPDSPYARARWNAIKWPAIAMAMVIGGGVFVGILESTFANSQSLRTLLIVGGLASVWCVLLPLVIIKTLGAALCPRCGWNLYFDAVGHFARADLLFYRLNKICPKCELDLTVPVPADAEQEAP